MADNNHNIPNVMPNAMIEPITDMALIMAKLKHVGEINKVGIENTIDDNNHKEV